MARLPPLFLFLFLALLPALLAATAVRPDETVWASVAFVVAGERTPALGPWRAVLTPDGAHQMMRQGEAFRTRYVLFENENGLPQYSHITRARLNHISEAALDASQVNVHAAGDDHVAAGALAFVQGLYPPASQSFAEDVGGINISRSAVTGKLTDYPLDGYQYPVVRTYGLTDVNSIFIQGHVGCPNWSNFTDVYAKPANQESYFQADPLIDSLFEGSALAGTVDAGDLNFWNARALYDLADFTFRHNSTVHDSLAALGRFDAARREMRRFALLEQLARNSDPSVSNTPDGLPDRLIPGRTLAYQILTEFRNSIAALGSENRLTLLFGSLEPLMALASLAGLRNASDPQSTSRFLPEPGSALVFELFTRDTNSIIPANSYLRVRALYRPGADAPADFEPQAMFGRRRHQQSGGDGDGDDDTWFSMSYPDFADAVSEVGYSLLDWCSACGARTMFCAGQHVIHGDPPYWTGGDPDAGYVVTPAIAGVIGGAVTVTALGLALLAAMALCGVRFHRNRREVPGGGDAAAAAAPGGFKGPRKMASDADVEVSLAGAARERVGSWELKDEGAPASRPPAPGPGGRILKTTDIRTVSTPASGTPDDDAASALSDMEVEPVKPRDMV